MRRGSVTHRPILRRTLRPSLRPTCARTALVIRETHRFGNAPNGIRRPSWTAMPTSTSLNMARSARWSKTSWKNSLTAAPSSVASPGSGVMIASMNTSWPSPAKAACFARPATSAKFKVRPAIGLGTSSYRSITGLPGCGHPAHPRQGRANDSLLRAVFQQDSWVRHQRNRRCRRRPSCPPGSGAT